MTAKLFMFYFLADIHPEFENSPESSSTVNETNATEMKQGSIDDNLEMLSAQVVVPMISESVIEEITNEAIAQSSEFKRIEESEF